MKKNFSILIAALAAAVLTSCGGGQQGLPTSNEYPVITIGASNAQLNTTYPATIKGIQDVQVRPKVLSLSLMFRRVSTFTPDRFCSLSITKLIRQLSVRLKPV